MKTLADIADRLMVSVDLNVLPSLILVIESLVLSISV